MKSHPARYQIPIRPRVRVRSQPRVRVPVQVPIRGQPRRGFTLLELIVALSIVTLLFGAMSSAILITTKALPNEDTASIRLIRTGRVAEKIALELQGAKTITTATATTLQFTVADRDIPVDGVDETIRYTWSGTAGDPLTRKYSTSGGAQALGAVRAFDLEYLTRTDASSGTRKLLSVQITLNTTTSPGTRVITSALTLNEPTMP